MPINPAISALRMRRSLSMLSAISNARVGLLSVDL